MTAIETAGTMRRWHKLALAIPAGLLIVGAAGYFYAQYQARAAVDELLAQLVVSGQVQQADYQRVRLTLQGDLEITDLRLATPYLTLVLRALSVSDIDFAHPEPWHLRLHAQDLYFPEGLDGAALLGDAYWQALKDALLHDNTLAFSFDYQYRYEPANQEQLTSNATLEVPGLFTLALANDIRHVTPAQLFATTPPAPASQPAAVPAWFVTAAFPGTELTLHDAGVVDHWLQGYAASYNTEAAAMRTQLQSQVRNLYLFLTPDVETFARTTGNELAEFLEGGRTLQLTIHPSYGGDLTQLQPEVTGAVFTANFGKAVELLGVQLRTD